MEKGYLETRFGPRSIHPSRAASRASRISRPVQDVRGDADGPQRPVAQPVDAQFDQVLSGANQGGHVEPNG